ncbi:MAG TPA: hypothetical protein VEC93_03295 [Anaerolineae bacterium]|nr:hypothetical protein [Anaerolineae bacterium]
MNLWNRFVTWLTDADPKAVADLKTQPVNSTDPRQDVEAQLKVLEDKLDQTVQDLADGLINRAQFENLYRHYQNQRRVVRGFLEQASDPAMLKVGAGESMVIRQRYAAKVLAYAVYDNLTSLPLHTVGQFPLESELVVGFFSGFRSAIAEIMGTGARKAITDDGKVLIYVPGQKTTLIVLYSSEPADIESLSLRQAHEHFEKINAAVLVNSPIPENQLIFNYDMFLKSSQSPV